MRFSFLISIVATLVCHAQHDSLSRFSHAAGFGIQQVAHTDYQNGHTYSYLMYRNPCYSGFYQLFVRTGGTTYVTAALRSTYRYGNGGWGDGGRAGGYDNKVVFSVLKNDLSVGFGYWLGKKSNCFMGYGIYFGHNTVLAGSGEQTSWGFTNTSITNVPAIDFLGKFYYGLNYQVMWQVKLKSRNYLLFCTAIQLETPEPGGKIGRILDLALGYKFGRTR